MDWEIISDGLTLSVFGLMTTFLALGLFIGSMYLLRWLFPAEKRRRTPLLTVSVPVVEAPSRDEEAETLAAVTAAALALRKAVSSPQGMAPEAAAAAAAAWWLKQNRAGSQLAAVQQAPIQPRRGLGARLEGSRGRWWQPLGED